VGDRGSNNQALVLRSVEHSHGSGRDGGVKCAREGGMDSAPCRCSGVLGDRLIRAKLSAKLPSREGINRGRLFGELVDSWSRQTLLALEHLGVMHHRISTCHVHIHRYLHNTTQRSTSEYTFKQILKGAEEP